MRAYEELDRAPTPWGEVLLVRRRVPGAPDGAAYEVKLGGALLMSSLVTESERALASLALSPPEPARPRVLVGGLGLGATAAQALAEPRVTEVEIVELLPQVIDWHRRGLVPLARTLTSDPRCRLVQADVFARLEARPTTRWDAILLDVDHSPDALLRPEHGAFYTRQGLAAAAEHLAPGGVLGVWSALAPEPEFERRLAAVFARVRGVPVAFWNANNDADEVNAVYLAWR
jgi:spermidine synthase